MTDADRALARRAAACEHWKWRAGMRVVISYAEATASARIVSARLDGIACADERGLRYGWHHLGAGPAQERCLPDLADAATMGCLLALVREAWPGWRVTVEWGGEPSDPEYGWVAVCYDDRTGEVRTLGPDGGTETDALVAALEAAP